MRERLSVTVLPVPPPLPLCIKPPPSAHACKARRVHLASFPGDKLYNKVLYNGVLHIKVLLAGLSVTVPSPASVDQIILVWSFAAGRVHASGHLYREVLFNQVLAKALNSPPLSLPLFIKSSCYLSPRCKLRVCTWPPSPTR